jgi:hypothetical protein
MDVSQFMAARNAALNSTVWNSVRGLPQPLTDGGPGYRPNRYNAPVYSASGLSHIADTPYIGQAGAINPTTVPRPFAPQNPGSMDPVLGMTIKAGDSGFMSRGALAFLGQGFNPWAREVNGAESSPSAEAGGQIDQLFQLANNLGIDTTKYSREPGSMGIRGERSGQRDAMALYDEVNRLARDYVSVGGLSSGWSGGGPSAVARTIYKEVDGKLLPVTRPQFHTRQTNNGFISRDAIAGMSLMLPAVGGWAGILGQGGAGTLNAGAGLGLTSSLPASAVNIGVNTLLSGRFNPMSLLGLVGGGSSPYQSPMTSFQGALGSTGLGRSELGRGTSLVRLLGALAGRS